MQWITTIITALAMQVFKTIFVSTLFLSGIIAEPYDNFFSEFEENPFNYEDIEDINYQESSDFNYGGGCFTPDQPIEDEQYIESAYHSHYRAHVRLVPSTRDGPVRGHLTLYQRTQNSPVTIEGQVTGLTPGLHGFHIHEKGSTDDECNAAGTHFNPSNMKHGGHNAAHRHAGDMGNIYADHFGVANVKKTTYGISLVPGTATDVNHRTFVVHAKEDDLGQGHDEESHKTGNAGPRIACGVILPASVY